MVIITDTFGADEWDEFVFNHSNGNIFQTSMINSVYSKTRNYEPICFVARDSTSGELLAVMQSVIISEMQNLLSSFSSRAVLHGGPLFVDCDKGREAAQRLMEHYDKVVGSRIVYTQIRNMWDTEAYQQVFGSNEYKYDQHLDFLIDLSRNETDIWQSINKSRRKGINRAEKSGILVKRVSNEDELLSCYNLVLETYKRFKVPVADISLFQAAYEELASTGCADFFIAFKGEEAVGTRITLNYRDMVYDWYAGSKQEVDYVDEALVWQILKENAGSYKVFDFGGAGHPDKPYGVREFKRRFGGEMVNFGRYTKVHSKTKQSIAKYGYMVFKKIKK